MNILKILRLKTPGCCSFASGFQFSRKLPTNNVLRKLSTVSTQNISSTNIALLSPLSQKWIWKKWEPIELPVSNTQNMAVPLEMPAKIEDNEISEPPFNINIIRKEAARLIVIRRKKMKKHKLKKLRKKMKYEWAKLRQRRELIKEKAFQAQLIAQCKNAEEFNAEQYVKDQLRLASPIINDSIQRGPY